MKILIIQLAKFLSIGVLVYLFLALIIPPTMVNNFYDTEWREKLFVQDAKSLDVLDVLILGSSHVFKTFDPRVFKDEGYQLLNLASPSQTPENSYFILKDFFDGALSPKGQRPTPKVIVHELYCKTISDRSPLESYIKSVEHHPSTYNFFKLGVLTYNATSINMFFSSMLKRMFGLYEEERSYSDIPDYVRYGYYKTKSVRGKSHPRYDIPIEQMVFENEQEKIQYKREKIRDSKICSGAPSKRQMSYLKKIIDLSKSHGVPVVLVVAPMPSDFTENITNYGEILSALTSFASDNGVLLIKDFNSVKIDENTDFADRDHLNVLGATKVSKFFIQKLEKEGVLR